MILAWMIFPASIFIALETCAQTPADSALWKKAIEIADKNREWRPGKISEKELLFSQDGEIQEKTLRELRFCLDKNQSLGVTLVRATLNGEDISDKEKARFESKNEQKEYVNVEAFEAPFLPEVQPTLSNIYAIETAFLDSIECRVFRYRQTLNNTHWQGKAWIAKTTGIPLRAEFKAEEALEENNATLTDFTGTFFYRNASSTAWYPVRMLYRMGITTKVFPFYTFKGQVKTEIYLNEYFQHSQDE